MGGPYDRKSARPKAAAQQLLQLGSITEGFTVAPTETLNRWEYGMEVALTTQHL